MGKAIGIIIGAVAAASAIFGVIFFAVRRGR